MPYPSDWVAASRDTAQLPLCWRPGLNRLLLVLQQESSLAWQPVIQRPLTLVSKSCWSVGIAVDMESPVLQLQLSKRLHTALQAFAAAAAQKRTSHTAAAVGTANRSWQGSPRTVR